MELISINKVWLLRFIMNIPDKKMGVPAPLSTCHPKKAMVNFSKPHVGNVGNNLVLSAVANNY